VASAAAHIPIFPGSRVAMSITVARADGPAISGTASGTMSGSPLGCGPKAPSGWAKTMRMAIMKRITPPAMDNDVSERCMSSRSARPNIMKSARIAAAIAHSRTITRRRRGAATSASIAFTSGTLPNGSITSRSNITAETNSVFIWSVIIFASMSRVAFLCLLAGGCAIAFAPIFVRLADTGPVASAFWRCALAVPVLWAWVFARARSEERISRWALAGAGLFFAADLGVWHFSILFTSVANSTVLANLAPIFVTLAGWLLWRTRVSRTFVVGMLVSIAGMFVLVGPNFATGGKPLVGDALGALTAVFYAGYFLTIKAARDAGTSTARLMAWSTTITAAVLLPIALAAPQPFLAASASGWLVLLGLALISQVLGQGLIAYAFAHLPASLSSVSLLIQPVMAALFAWWLFGEAVGPMQFAGGAMVLAGIWLAKKAS
jgi:drug/metabolite transporter (DMT)-like permease